MLPLRLVEAVTLIMSRIGIVLLGTSDQLSGGAASGCCSPLSVSITPANTDTTINAEIKSAAFPMAAEPFGLPAFGMESLCAELLREEVPEAEA